MSTQDDTSTELEQVEHAEIEVMERETYFTTQRALRVEAKAREMSAYYKLAQALSKTKMVKDTYQWNGITNTEHPQYDLSPVQNLAAAMMFGAKLGIEPEDAGLLVISIKGTPSLEAKTMVGIIRSWCDRRIAQGRTTTFREGGDWIWEVEADENHVIWAGRRDGDEKSCEWTMARADNAGYTDDFKTSGGTKKSMYKTIPIEMLRARAQSEIARLLFSDVLRGMQYSAEEMQLVERSANRPVQQEVRPGRGMAALENHVQQGGHLAAYGGAGAVVDGEVADGDTEGGSAPESAPSAQEDAGDVIATERDLTPLHIKLTECEVTERAAKINVLSALVDRELSSSKELTSKEVHHVIAVLNGWQRQKVAVERCAELAGTTADVPPEQTDKASTQLLRKMVTAYKKSGITGVKMLDHISGTVGYSCDDINVLSEDDVNDCIRKVSTN